MIKLNFKISNSKTFAFLQLKCKKTKNNKLTKRDKMGNSNVLRSGSGSTEAWIRG